MEKRKVSTRIMAGLAIMRIPTAPGSAVPTR